MLRAAVLTSPGSIEIQERPAVEPRTGEAVVRVEAAGVCGTDLALHSGDYPVPLPLVLGHEVVGRVVRVGSSTDEGWLGERVALEINDTCLARHEASPCRACVRQHPHHCLRRTVMGIIERDGGFAEEVSVPTGVLHQAGDLEPLTAVLIEPLAAALQTFVMRPLTPGELVVVVGPGRLGILIAFAASSLGATVYAVARSASRRERALRYGADRALSPDEASAIVEEATGGFGADVVVEATGSPEGIGMALDLVRPEGTICLKTTCGLPASGLDATRVVVDEVRIQGSRCGPFPEAIELLRQHRTRLSPLVTTEWEFPDVGGAIEAASREDKVVISFPDPSSSAG